MEKSLDRKLARILADPSCRDFILADAKDADMAFGLAAPGRSPEHHAGEARFRTLDEYRQLMREIVAQGLVDIMLMSASSNEVLTIQRAAVRAEPRHAGGPRQRHDRHLAGRRQRAVRAAAVAALPHRHDRPHPMRQGGVRRRRAAAGGRPGALLRHLQQRRRPGPPHAGMPTRRSASRPKPRGSGISWRSSTPTPPKHPPADVGRFINDHIVRALAGVTSRGRPLFLKIVYHGPAAMEALARYDRSLVVGILGGSAGTTFDAFHMLWEAKKYGARVALYGRKINNAEHQLSFIEHLRAVADDQLEPDEAVKAYHGALAAAGHPPAPLAGRRPAADRDGVELQRHGLIRPQARPAAPRQASASKLPAVEALRRAARLQQDVAGREGPVEPRPLEADRGVSRPATTPVMALLVVSGCQVGLSGVVRTGRLLKRLQHRVRLLRFQHSRLELDPRLFRQGDLANRPEHAVFIYRLDRIHGLVSRKSVTHHKNRPLHRLSM